MRKWSMSQNQMVVPLKRSQQCNFFPDVVVNRYQKHIEDFLTWAESQVCNFFVISQVFVLSKRDVTVQRALTNHLLPANVLVRGRTSPIIFFNCLEAKKPIHAYQFQPRCANSSKLKLKYCLGLRRKDASAKIVVL